MKSFSRRHWPLFAVVAILVAGAALAHGGYIDPTYFAAAPLMLPIGMTASVPTAKLLRGAMAKREDLIKAANAITASVGEGASLSAEQLASINKHLADVKALDGEIGALQAMVEAERGSVEIGKILKTTDNREVDPKRGFKNFGEFAIAVKNAGVDGGITDERLRIGAAAPGTFSGEGSGADGGFLVPTDFATDITKLSLSTDNFLTRCTNLPVSGNSISFPSDETTPWGSNGVRAQWAVEAAAAAPQKPIIKQNVMRLNKLISLVPVSDEQLVDAPFTEAYLKALMARSVKWKVNDAIVNGLGAGMPLGILQGGGLAVVNKDAGQAANTISAQNVANLFAAMPAGYLDGAEWIVGPDTFAKVITLQLGNFAIWTPPMAGFQQAPGGFLFGKPLNISQTAAAFSSQGDIVFTNFGAYFTISKDGIQIASSMHLYFDADATAFRATFRLDGQPAFKQTIAQARGAQVLSPYVTLQAR